MDAGTPRRSSLSSARLRFSASAFSGRAITILGTGASSNSSVSVNVRYHRYFITAGSDQIHPNPDIAPTANQFRTTFGYGDNNRQGWNAAFSTVYDYRASKLEYGIAQVTYNTSCCGFSVQVRRLAFRNGGRESVSGVVFDRQRGVRGNAEETGKNILKI